MCLPSSTHGIRNQLISKAWILPGQKYWFWCWNHALTIQGPLWNSFFLVLKSLIWHCVVSFHHLTEFCTIFEKKKMCGATTAKQKKECRHGQLMSFTTTKGTKICDELQSRLRLPRIWKHSVKILWLRAFLNNFESPVLPLDLISFWLAQIVVCCYCSFSILCTSVIKLLPLSRLGVACSSSNWLMRRPAELHFTLQLNGVTRSLFPL